MAGFPFLLFGGGDAPSLRSLFSGFDPGAVSFSRASVGAAWGRGGLFLIKPDNAPRWEYDQSTKALKGLFVERQRTNSLRNSVFEGGGPGALPTNVSVYNSGAAGISSDTIGIGVENGLAYCDMRFYGTPTGTGQYQLFFESYNNIAAVQGETFIFSLFARLGAGSASGATFSVAINEYLNTVYQVGATGSSFSISSSFPSSPFVLSRTLTDSDTNCLRPRFNIHVTSGVAIDMTIRFYAPQVEKVVAGESVSSHIVTNGVAATRAADQLSFAIPSGFSTLRYVFDNDTTQDVAVSAGAYTVPTDLNRSIIKRITTP